MGFDRHSTPIVRRRPLRVVALGLAAALVWAIVPATTAQAAATSTVIDGFDRTADWMLTGGSGTIASSGSSAGSSSSATGDSASTGALKLSYNLSGGDVRLGKSTTPAAYGSLVYTKLSVLLKGDGTWNTLFVRLRDASGELLTYRLGTLNSTAWTTMAADLSSAPAGKERGDGDGVLDAPFEVLDFRVDRNGSQPATGSVTLDQLALSSDNWSVPKSSVRRFAASLGGGTYVSFTAGAPGDWSLVLKDLSGKTKTLTGTATQAGTVKVAWNGRSDTGTFLSGSIEGQLRYDSTPNGSLGGTVVASSNPYLTGITLRPVDINAASFAGVNSSLTTLDSASAADAQAALLEAGRLRYAREEFDWNRVEPRQDYFDWWKFDQAVNLLYARNVSVIGKLVYSAAWASSAPAGTASSDVGYYPPTKLADYIDYVEKTVARYKDRVTVWEVWNEPNTKQYWKPGPDSAAYAAMLKATYAAIKRIDPNATVLAGSLSGFDAEFAAGLVKNGAGKSYDGLSFHAFLGNTAPESSILPTWLASASSFVQRENPGASLWITELGWSTCSDGCENGVDEATQASYLSRAYLMAAKAGIRSVAWWGMVEFGDGPGRLDNYGLVTRAGRQKPAYAALTALGTAAAETRVGVLPVTDGAATVVSGLSDVPAKAASTIGGTDGVTSVGKASVAGRSGLKLGYSFASAKGVKLDLSIPIPGKPSAISLLVSGDASASHIYLSFTDAKGEKFEAKVGNVGGSSWERQVFYLDGANPNYSASGDGKVDYPITVTSLSVYAGILGVRSGQLVVSDLTAHAGTSMRGVLLTGSGFSIATPYSAAPATVRLTMKGSKASLGVVGGTPITLVDGRIPVSLTRSVQYVRSQ